MLHGKFLKRSSLPGLDRTSYTSMLRVGGELELQGRHVRLYECDESTRAHFASKCITQPANSVPPTDAYTEAAVSERAS